MEIDAAHPNHDVTDSHLLLTYRGMDKSIVVEAYQTRKSFKNQKHYYVTMHLTREDLEALVGAANSILATLSE